MATNKKIPSQGNLVDMLAAFGRGALGTLTDRFNQYNAALESVATHEQTLDKHLQVLNSISETKVEWFVIPITAAVYEDILSGVKDYITIPYDISTLIEGDSRLTTGQAGIKLEVAGEASVNAVYLPFTLVSQAYILPSFDDLVIRGTSLSSGKAYDTRYKVDVNVQTGYIVLEKVEESASLPWLEINTQDDLYNGIANLNPGEKFELVPQSTDINPNEDLSKYCGLRLHDTYDNVWYLPWAYILDDRSEYDTCPFMFNGKTLRAEVIGASVWFINNDPDLSDYAKKTDVETALSGMVKIQKLTQEEYDALKTKDENVLYAIIER